jgi:hypothetical protein
MFSAEVRSMLAQVITSWQVIAVTVVFVIYVSLVKYVSRIHHRRSRDTFMPRSRKKSEPAETAAPPPPAPVPAAKTESEEMGLEEDEMVG